MSDEAAPEHEFARLSHNERTPTYTEEHASADMSGYMDTTFASRYVANPIARFKLPKHGAPANVVYQLIKDVRTLDATPRLNLASFVTTWMEPEAIKLIEESLDINYVDTEEYPSSTEIQNRCVSMLAKLFNAPGLPDKERGDPVGTATVGSSEAIMLGALSLKKRWVQRRKDAGLPYDKPNLVMGSHTHVCWQKFCRYFDVEERYVDADEGRYAPEPQQLVDLVDENTIGVASVLGSTYTGELEDVAELDRLLSEKNEENPGWEVGIHVDAASGGFVVPFLYPDLAWDFRLKNVASINVSGHKYGLVFPGVGWVIWRDAERLSPDLVFIENYLGSEERSITLNFSKGASQIVAQYYQFLRLGRDGYTKIMRNLDIIRIRLRRALEDSQHFETLSPEVGVPVVTFRLTPYVSRRGNQHPRAYDEYAVADRVRLRGWVIPAYTMPPGAEHIKVLRVTIREDLSMQMADHLVDDLTKAVAWLDSHFIFTRDQVDEIAHEVLGQRTDSMQSLESNICTALDVFERSRRIVKPC